MFINIKIIEVLFFAPFSPIMTEKVYAFIVMCVVLISKIL